MNYRRNLGCLAFCIFFVTQVKSQYTSELNQSPNLKPNLFKQITRKSQCNFAALGRLFSETGVVGEAISQGFFLQGEIIENIQQNPNVQSIRIKLTHFPGAIFTLSRIKLEDGSIRYNGHIISSAYNDALVLSLENGKYYLTKTELRLLITE